MIRMSPEKMRQMRDLAGTYFVYNVVEYNGFMCYPREWR
jgi:hypothetical protein